MTTEEKLIQKSYYQTILDENHNEHPIKTLGKMYMEEMQDEQPNLSSIRFAQGEIYFLNEDYEAAIYKWQHPLEQPLIPWAQKNIADAHMEMGLLDFAEKHYKEVETDSVSLKSEVLLQLFSLYIQQEKIEKAVYTIKKAIRLNPDYRDVTELAKRYFEEIQDWDSAVELAVQEAVRTEEFYWFDCLEGYANREFIAQYEPMYFKEALASLFYKDKSRFEKLTENLWNRYRESDFYVLWLTEINEILLTHNSNSEQTYPWEKLPRLFEEAYFYLISGKFLVREITQLTEDHLTNWFIVSSASGSLGPSTAILAWEEIFPSETAATLAENAQAHLKDDEPIENGKEEGIGLWNAMKEWADQEGLLEGLLEHMEPTLSRNTLEAKSPAEIRDLLKDSLQYMLDQRNKVENMIIQNIDSSVEVLGELNVYQEQLTEVKEQKTNLLVSSFLEVKNKVKEYIETKLPEVLRSSADVIDKDADLSKLPAELNEEMNKRIAQHLKRDVYPKFERSYKEWLKEAEKELEETQHNWTAFSEEINHQLEEERIVLAGDFQLLNDWKRDLERTARVLFRPVEMNILLQNNPSQLLLKGAGKLFGSFGNNKEMLVNRYKDYIEKEDYNEIAARAVDSFMQQLELFEESIEWDVHRFFSTPEDELVRMIEEVEQEIEEQNEALNTMRENPEIYQDPLKLFRLKLRQYELKYRI